VTIKHLQYTVCKAQKYPQQEQQTHYQKDAVDPCKGGIGSLRSNLIEPVAVLALTRLSINRNAL
jgi:hypothetical protein